MEVWFDQNELRGGDEWDRAIRRQIRECALFVPVISANTQQRTEGYFRLEWHLAEQRSLLKAKGLPFIVPVCIDDTPERVALVPEAFLAVQWTRLSLQSIQPAQDGRAPGGSGDESKLGPFLAHVRGLLGNLQGLPVSRPPTGEGPGREPRVNTPSSPVIPDYELLRKIGSGSYGDVWLARGLTGIWRAIKIVWRARFTDAAPYEREWRGLKEFAEVSLGESIQMALLHVGRNDAAEYFYYVMELADDVERGREIVAASYTPLTLSALRTRRGRLPAEESVKYGVELARVLASLHRRGLVHRDIKPSNVILVGGVPKLADIGLVSPEGEAKTFIGTEGFVPPEGPGSPAADVYALGKVIYELATGLDQQEFPQLPAELSRLPDQRALLRLNDVILRACEPAGARRYRDAAALLVDLTALQAGRSVRRTAGWQMAAAAAALAVAITAGLWWWPRVAGQPGAADSRQTPPRETAAAVSDKSVVVLPFENLSPDPDNAFFSEGLHADIVAAVSRLSDLKVISRNAALHYKDSKATLLEIARTLRVAHVITGSVRRVGARARIQLELRRASDESLLWSPTYDRDANDVLGIQREVADQVARVLQARQLTGRAAGAQLYTSNPQAYELFLKALKILWSPEAQNVAGMTRSCEKFSEVVALDPKFAWAIFFLSTAHAQVWEFERDPVRRAPHKAEARRWAEVATQLDVASGDAAMSYYLTRIEGEPARGLEFAQRSARLLPNDTLVHLLLGLALERLNRYPEALKAYERVNEIDPFELKALYNRLWGLTALRREREFGLMLDRFFATGGGEVLAADVAGVRYPLRAEIPTNLKLFPPLVQTDWLLKARRWEEVRQLAATALADPTQSEMTRCDLGRAHSDALRHLGRSPEARAASAAALALAEKLREKNPEGQALRTVLSLSVAGRAEEAIGAARRYVSDDPGRNYPTARWRREQTLARVLARAGRTRESVALIKQLLALPSFLTVPMLRAEYEWDSLRDDPEFIALLADPKNSAPF